MTGVTVIWDGEQYDGELINGFVYAGKSRRKVTYGHRLPAGKSIREMIWDQLDDAMDTLMEGPPKNWREIDAFIEDIDWSQYGEDWKRYGHEQGVAQATAFIISLFEDPTHPDMDSVRAAAVERYKERQQLAELKTLEDKVKDDGVVNPPDSESGNAGQSADETSN